MKGSFQKQSFLIILAAILLSSALWANTYPVLVAKVPFKFSVGKHTFAPGEYRFAAIGVGLLAVLDSHKKVVAVFMTRTPQTPSADHSVQLVFQKGKKVSELSRISMGGNEQEIVAEEPAGHDTRRESVPVESFAESGETPVPLVRL